MRNPRKEKERRFVDVAPVKKNKALFLKERIFRFELNFSRLWFWVRQHRMLAGISALFSLVLLVGLFGLLIRAQIVTLTPSSCLGGWTNPAYAEGLPDATRGENSSYTQENSAVLYNKISEIFCGDFSGDVPEGALPVRATLSFSLAMKSKSEFFAEPTVEETNSFASTTATSSEEIFDASSTLPEKILEEKIIPFPIENTSSSEAQSPSAWFLKLFHSVFAQEEGASLSEETQNISENVSVSENTSGTIIASSSYSGEENTSGTTLISVATTTQEENKKGLYDFEYDSVIEIVWSTNGAEWQSLGYLNPRNYTEAKFDLPLVSWEELKNLQVRLRSVNATDALPAVFLDAVLLDVEFEKNNEPALSEEEEFTRMFEGLRPEQMPAGFSAQNITFLQGAPHLGVILKFLNNGREELWLIGKEIINIDGGKSIHKDFPIGIKSNFVFWLSDNKETVFAYDSDKKIRYEVSLPPLIDEETEKRFVTFTDIPWVVVVASNNFYFQSEKTGEVFSDSTSLPLEIFNRKLNLEGAVSQEKLETLGVPVQEKENYESTE